MAIEDGVFLNHLNVELFYQTLARIIGEKEGVKITVTVRPKEPGPEAEKTTQEKGR